jgi:F0F1-type ATP synthase assembly protein I
MMDYLKYINIGIMLVAPAAVGLLLGALIDRQVNAFPIFTIAMLILGIISGIWGLYKSVKNLV